MKTTHMKTTQEITTARLDELQKMGHRGGSTHHGGNGDIYFRALLRFSKYPVRHAGSHTAYCALWRWSGKKGGAQAWDGSSDWQIYTQNSHPEFNRFKTTLCPLVFQRLDEVIEFVEEANQNEAVEFIPATLEYRVHFMDHSSFGHGVNFIFPSRKSFEDLIPDFEDALLLRKEWDTPVGRMKVLGRTDDVYVVELR